MNPIILVVRLAFSPSVRQSADIRNRRPLLQAVGGERIHRSFV
jgi:hypothetical protein